MNIPPLDFQEFLAEYGSLAFPDQRVLRGDFFCHRENRKWLTVFVTEQDGNQLLTDAEGHIRCRYDRIMPLFVSSPVKVSGEIQDLLEQLSGLRSRVPLEDYERARTALQSLTQPAHPPAPAYLVLQEGRMGVVTPEGTRIVPIEYTRIQPFAFTSPGNAGIFLCQKGGHSLNSMDVYDWNGTCIFRQIGNLLPREETVLTPAVSGHPLRSVKSLWVVRQTIDHPFPENPDFQLVREQPQRYTLKALRCPDYDDLRPAAMEDRPVWLYCREDQVPPDDALYPLAATIGERIGCYAEKVISRLPDYRVFRRERMPLSVRLANVTAHTPLNQLGFSIRAHHCLVRSGLQTAADVMNLTQEAIDRLPRSTQEIAQEITAVRNALAEPGILL